MKAPAFAIVATILFASLVISISISCDTEDEDSDADAEINQAEVLDQNIEDELADAGEADGIAGSDKAKSLELVKLTARDPEERDYFGHSVAIDGDYAVVGAYGKDDYDWINTGAAYVFHQTDAGAWEYEAKLEAPIEERWELFGWSVSISGDYIIVGAILSSGKGAAYVFHRTGKGAWDRGVKIVAPDVQKYDCFGFSVSISGDYAAVGSPGDDDSGSQSGAIYVFHRIDTNSWDSGVKIAALDAQQENYFGAAVAISGDYVVAGSIGDCQLGESAGAAYVFERTGTNAWDSATMLAAPDAHENDFFGFSVSIAGDYAIVGAIGSEPGQMLAGSAYVFHRIEANAWNAGTKIVAPEAATGDLFGWSVAIHGDYAVVGAIARATSGAGYIFHRNGDDDWSEGAEIAAPDAQPEELFGWSVSISGNRSLLGARCLDGYFEDEGAAYVYTLECGSDDECDDGLWCNGEEFCDAQAVCQAGNALDCDDKVGCTDDYCDETSHSCINEVNDAYCDNGLWCDGAEICDDVNDCQDSAPPCDEQAEVCDEAAEHCNEINADDDSDDDDDDSGCCG